MTLRTLPAEPTDDPTIKGIKLNGPKIGIAGESWFLWTDALNALMTEAGHVLPFFGPCPLCDDDASMDWIWPESPFSPLDNDDTYTDEQIDAWHEALDKAILLAAPALFPEPHRKCAGEWADPTMRR